MASGETLMVFTPLHSEQPSAGAATLDIRGQGHPVVDFDAASIESTIFRTVCPRNYNDNGFTVYIHFAMSTATSGSVRWKIYFERIGDEILDLDTLNWSPPIGVTAAVSSTCGKVKITEFILPGGGDATIEPGEGFRMKVERDATHGDDDAAGDAELVFVELMESL